MARSLMDEFGIDAQTDRHARMTTATMYMGASPVCIEIAMKTLITSLSWLRDCKNCAILTV